MGLINGCFEIKAKFIEELKKFVPAILTYGENSSKRNVARHVVHPDLIGICWFFINQSNNN